MSAPVLAVLDAGEVEAFPVVSPRDALGDRWRTLPVPLRMLLSTDGTVTTMLEVLADDPVAVDVLEPGRFGTDPTACARRRVVLRARGLALVYAETLIWPASLPAEVAATLAMSASPIGAVLEARRVEQLREITHVGYRPVPHVELDAGEVPCRSYRVRAGGRSALFITEWFLDGLVDVLR